jgi:tRNA (guanine37-N1)-methyltransferase
MSDREVKERRPKPDLQPTIQPTLDVLSLFPQTVRSVLDSSILRRAQLKGQVELLSSDLRAYSSDNYGSVDDTPFGGSQGMLFTAPVLNAAFEDQLRTVGGKRENLKIIYPSPRGLRLNQTVVQELSQWLAPESGEARRVCVLCGRYEGIDERAVDTWVDLELSLGDYILTGGELPALTLVDAMVRLLPGVLGDEKSHRDESFSNGLLEYPQYTKPREFQGQGVPPELLSGHHAKIEEWKLRESLLMSFAFRPDLIREHSGEGFPKWALELLKILKNRLMAR